MGEKPGGLAQERAFGFHPSKLLKKREGDDLGVRELLQGLVVLTVRVEGLVGVVDLAEQNDERLF